jgi:hypothetical protein
VNRFLSASPIKSALAALAIVSGLAVPGAYAAQPVPPFAADDCGYTRGATGCTANDTNDMSITLDPLFAGADPTSCNAGDNVTIHLKVTVGTTATERYNLGFLFSKDGKSPIDDPATTGATSCSAFTLPSPPFPELDTTPNSCGDQSSVSSNSFTTGAITVKCIAGAGGKLLIPYVGLWNNQTAACSGVTDLVAGTSSKCTYNQQTVNIDVVTPTGSVQLVKDVVPNSDTGKFNLSVTPSGGAAATATDVGDGGSVTKSSITAGTVVTLAETAGTGTSLANYTSSLACVNSATGASVPVTSNQITMPTPPIGIVCTYTNTRKQGTLQVRKTWVNAHVGDTAAISVSGIVNAATAGLDSTANSANETDPGSVVVMYVGETALMNETVNPTANYSSSFSCSAQGYAFKLVGEQVTMPNSPPTDIVCTYTNTRKSTTLQLKKQWANANVGDTAALTATGITNSAGAALNSTAGSANELDAGSAVTVYAGEVATLGETVNPAANYTSTGPVCTGTSGLSGSTLTVGAADGPIVCTYTNTRKQGTLQVRKTWVNAQVGDSASISVTGIVNAATAGLNSTANSASETDPGSVVAMYAGEMATFSESVTPSANYTSSFECVASAGAAVGAAFAKAVGDTYTMPSTPVDVVCTYTNTRKSTTLQLKKQWASANVGDTASLTATGITNSAGAALSSTADTAGDLDSGAAVTVFAGEVATLGETVNPAANYTSTGPVCTGTTGLSGSTLTVKPGEGPIVCTYTNTRVQRSLTLKKTWVNGKPGDAVTATTTGLANNATVSSTADAEGDNTSTGNAVSNVAGAVVTLPAEQFTTGSQSNYTTTVACVGATLSGSTPGSTFTMPDGDVTCTYTNTRIQRGLTLKKTWVNGKPGDAVTATTTGLANNATVSSTADAEGDNTSTGNAVSNVAGAVVTLPAEQFTTGSQSNYTTTVACTGATLSGSTPGSTFTMPDGDVTCTYTNTRIQRSLTLKKTWVNGKPGDAVTATTTGLANNATVSSTADAEGDNTSTGNAVSNVAGAVVTLPAEVFDTGSQSNYTTTVACTGATLSGSTPGSTFTMPEGDVTCTYTNTRRSATLQFVNVWINAVVGDSINDTASGIVNSAGVALGSTAGAANETDFGPVVTVYAGEVGALLQGAVTGSGSTYLQSFSCSGNATPLAASNLSVSTADIAIVCTFVNERLIPAPPPLQQASAIPVTSPGGLALMAALLALLGAAATRRRGRH